MHSPTSTHTRVDITVAVREGWREGWREGTRASGGREGPSEEGGMGPSEEGGRTGGLEGWRELELRSGPYALSFAPPRSLAPSLPSSLPYARSHRH